MAFDGNITIGTTIDLYGMNNGLAKIAKSFKNLNKIAMAGLGAFQLVQVGEAAIAAASNLQEVQNIVDVAFGEMTDQIEKFAAIAIENYGMSEYTAKKTASSFMEMGKAMGFTAKDASNMAIRMTALTGDFSSFYNISQDYAKIALSAVYTGETETLKRYGIILTEANLQQYALSQGIETSVKKMDARSKALLRYNYILQATKDVEGDFVRTEGSWANQTRLLSERWNQFLIILGKGLIKVLTPLLQALNQILAIMIKFANTLGVVLTKLFGIKWDEDEKSTSGMANNIEDAAEAEDELGDAIKAANKEQKKQLQGYDELNNITTKEDKTSGAGGSVLPASFDPQDISDLLGEFEDKGPDVFSWIDELLARLRDLWNWLKQLAQWFLDGFKHAWDWLNIDEQIQNIIDHFKNILELLKNIFGDAGVQEAFNNFLQTLMYTLGEILASLVSIVLTVVENILGGIELYLAQNSDRIKQFLINFFNVWSEILKQVGDFFVAFANIFKAFTSKEGKQFTANLIGIYADALMAIVLLADKFVRDIITLLTQPIIDNQENIKQLLTDILGFFGSIAGSIKDFIDTTADNIHTMYDAHIKPFFDSLTSGISQIISVFYDTWETYIKPVMDEAAQRFDEFYKEHLQPVINEAIIYIGNFIDVLKALWENVLQPFIAWCIQTSLPSALQALQSISQFMMAFLGTVFDVVQGILKILNGMLDFLLGIFTGDFDRTWKGVAEILQGWATIMIGIWEGLVKMVQYLLETAFNNIMSMWNTFSGLLVSLLQNFAQIFINIWNGIFGKWLQAFSDNSYKIKDFINDIIGMFEGLVNSIINGVNDILDAISSISFDVPDWVPDIGGSSWGFSYYPLSHVRLPRLAKGGVIPPNKEFMAVLGDQKSGTNVEAPLATIQEALYNALMQAGLTGGSGSQDIVVQIDGREVARAVRKQDNIFRKSTGSSMFAY